MSTLNHWHPVLVSRHLRETPVAVRRRRPNLVVWRTPWGKLGAIEVHCPHRRMKLSQFDRVLGLNRERIERIYKPAVDQWLKIEDRILDTAPFSVTIR